MSYDILEDPRFTNALREALSALRELHHAHKVPDSAEMLRFQRGQVSEFVVMLRAVLKDPDLIK